LRRRIAFTSDCSPGDEEEVFEIAEKQLQQGSLVAVYENCGTPGHRAG
jgi:hypothetical protein